MNDIVFITFIIPTIGRPSLQNSIKSLINMNDKDWKAIIIFDRVKNNMIINDKRIITYEYNGENHNNFAGIIRNIGLEYCKKINTLWIGFLDDDDYLSNDYICKLKDEINIYNNIEVCIFRMGYNNNCILPFKNEQSFIFINQSDK